MDGMSDVLSAKIGGDDNKEKDKEIVSNAKDTNSYPGSNPQTRNIAEPKRSMDDIREEIEEMGGDPFFLTDDDIEEADFQSADAKEEVSVAEEKSAFLWDGEVIEDSYFD